MRRLSAIFAHAIGWPALLGGILIAGQVNSQPAENPAPVSKGRERFIAVGCRECHGRVAQGGFAPTLASTALPYQAFDYLVRHPANNMPAYSAKVLPDADLRLIYDYVKSQPGPKPQPGFSMVKTK